MQRSVAVLLVVALLTASLVVSVTFVSMDDGSAGIASADPEPSATAVNSSVGSTDQEFDRTTFDITIHEDGSARWTFEYERTLKTEQEVSEFESYADRFMAEETDLYTKFTEQATALVADGRQYTEREMAVTNFNRSASVDQSVNTVGVVRMSFTWEGFASTESGSVVVSDVFDGGFYIMDDQTLTIRAGENLVFDRAQPAPEYEYPTLHERDRLVWRGEQTFASGYPYVVLVSEDEVGADGGPLSGLPLGVLIGAALVGLGLLGAGAYLTSRRDGLPAPLERLPVPGERSATGEPDAASSGGVAPSTDAPGGAESSPIADEEFMTDEDRVTTLLSENGGRMKQVQIVEETDWSKSKVSMLLSEMESEGTISKLRVGRENIISLDGFEPEAAKSPHETERR